MDEERKSELIEFLRENLSLSVSSDSVYTGSMDGPLWRDQFVIRLKLCGEAISEEYL